MSVAINDELLGALRALPSRLTSEWVFPNKKNTGPVNGESFDRLVFRPALQGAGIKGFRWKDLRHTFATRLRMDGGADLKSIAELLVGRSRFLWTLDRKELAGVRDDDDDGTPRRGPA